MPMADNNQTATSENTRVTKAAGVVGSATLLSRILGLVRDVVIAGFFGASLSSDAFFMAFRIPNLLRRLFAEGSLTISFIPVFTEYLTTKGSDEAFEMARSALRLLSVILTACAVIGILFAPLIIRIIAWGWVDQPDKFEITVVLTRIMFPYIFFIGLVALAMGILNVLGHFAAPALAPVFLNLAMIGSVFLLSPHFDQPIIGLALGVLIGGVLQLALQIPFLRRKGFRLGGKTAWLHPGLKRVGVLMVPAVFGAAVYQISNLVDALLASFLPEGSVSYLYYADRIVQFPLGIFAIALATAVLPSLSRQAANDDMPGMKNTFGHAMRLIFFITLPAMIGLIVLREPIVALLFKRGAFDAESTRMTAYAVLFYGIGLWAFSAVRIVFSTFYAMQDTRTPVVMASLSLVAKIGLSVILMRYLAHGGLALATSLASMLNFGLLIWALRKRLGPLGLRSVVRSIATSAVCALIMGLSVGYISLLVIPDGSGGLMGLFFGLFGSIIAGILVYAGLAYLFKSPELEAVMDIVGKRNRE